MSVFTSNREVLWSLQCRLYTIWDSIVRNNSFGGTYHIKYSYGWICMTRMIHVCTCMIATISKIRLKHKTNGSNTTTYGIRCFSWNEYCFCEKMKTDTVRSDQHKIERRLSVFMRYNFHACSSTQLKITKKNATKISTPIFGCRHHKSIL